MNEQEPLELLIEEINNDDIDIKIDAIHKIPIVAAITGPETTRTKLLQVIQDVIATEEDELMYAIAEELFNLKDYIGGPLHYDKLLLILEKLAQEQETVVREEAVQSIRKLAKLMNTQHVRNTLYPMVLSLSESVAFPGKIAATYLFEAVYPHLNKDEKDAIRIKFIDLFNDETALVKRSMSKNLSSFAIVLDKEHIIKEIIPIVIALTKDENDLIRCNILESIITLTKKFNKDENIKYLITTLSEQFYNDKSYKVREEYAKYYSLMYENLGQEMVEEYLLPNINTLLNDPEAEVRAITLEALASWVHRVSETHVHGLVYNSIKLLSSDSNNNVKLRLAQLMGVMAQTQGATFTANKLYQIAIDLINYCDNNEVKIEIVVSLQEFVNVAGWQILTSSLNNMLLLLSKEKYWRVRKSVVALAIVIGKKCEKVDDFETFEGVLLKGLSDSAFQVRQKTVEGIRELGTHFGYYWVENKVMPFLDALWQQEDCSYLLRITVLYALEATCYTLETDDVLTQIFPTYLAAFSDKIPNVRIVAIKNIKKFVDMPIFLNSKSKIYKYFYDALAELASTSETRDEDVVYFASRSLEYIQV